MKNLQSKADEPIKVLRNLTTEFGPPTVAFPDVYKKQLQPIVESSLMFNSYHWTTNISEQKLIQCAGVQRLLGYDEGQFDFAKSYAIIHPKFRPFVIAYGLMAYRMLSDKKYRPLSTRTHYSIQFPVERADGQYLLVQMNASVVQVDASHFPIANYNRFEVLGIYSDTPILIKPHVYFQTELRDLPIAAERELKENVREILLKITKMSQTECEMMKMMNQGMNNHAIAESCKPPIAHDTVKTHCKNIKTKARKYLSPYFQNAREVATYLQHMEII
jgi:DNA-binding CsgD family transcriptional regulator